MSRTSMSSGRRGAASACEHHTHIAGTPASQGQSTDSAASWSAGVFDALREAAARIRPASSGWRLWQHLTAAEREQLGDDFDLAFREGTVGIWMRARGGTVISAILGAAREIGFLSSVTYDWLLRATADAAGENHCNGSGEAIICPPNGGTPPSPAADLQNSDKPVWQRETGAFLWRGRQLATFRRNRQPTLVEQVLNAFEAAGWASSIDNPFQNVFRQRISETLRYINHQLCSVRLHLDGRYLSWEVTKTNER